MGQHKFKEQVVKQKRRVFIGIPAYDSKIFIMGMASLFNNISALEKAGYDVTFHAQMGDCYVDQTRNHIVRAFLKSDFTDLIFVDNDLAFDADAMLKLMKQDVDVIGGAYPYRSQDLSGFPVSVKMDANQIPIGDSKLGILECSFIPTGFMRIKREVFNKLVELYPNDIDHLGERIFFKTGMLYADKGDKQWYGEDVYFCRMCNDNGIKVWCEPRIGFAHIGTLHKAGNYDTWLRTEGCKPPAK